MICLDFSLIFLSIFLNFYKLLQIITNCKNSQKNKKTSIKKFTKIYILKKTQKFNIKKFTKNYILKKNQKFNIKQFTKNYIIKS